MLVESDEQAEEWTETDDSTPVVFDEHDEDYDTSDTETDKEEKSQQEDTTERGDNDDNSIATSNNEEEVNQPRRRKERSDKGKHHEGYHSKGSTDSYDFNDDDEDDESRREDIKDRLEKEWAQRKSREVKAPRSSSHNDSEETPTKNLEEGVTVGGNFSRKTLLTVIIHCLNRIPRQH